MKKRFLTLALVFALCLTLVPATAIAAESIAEISIKIPGCGAVFTLEDASAEYVIATSYDGLPEYRFALPGYNGKITCDSTADIMFGQTWEDVIPQNSDAGGGEYTSPAGWSQSCPAKWRELDGKGMISISLVVHEDGTLEGWEKPSIARIVFYFGEPIFYTAGGEQPADMISWESRSSYVPGATAGGPNYTAPVDLPKHPVAGLAVSAPADAPSGWAAPEVNAAIAAGLVPENLQKNYTKPISRGDVAQMFINLIEKASGQTIDEFMVAKGVTINNGVFSDTTDKAVLAANALGIINGVGSSKFDPAGTLTRAQIAAIINRVARALGVNTEGYAHGFTDVGGHWVNAELGWPVHAGIVKGTGGSKYEPDGKLTTEQAIAITYRALDPLTK